MQHELDSLSRKTAVTIFRVPAAGMWDARKELFEPSAISIGPFYRGRPSLRAMEDSKWRHVHHFLSRESAPSLEACIREMAALEPEARSCYGEPVDLERDEFVQMMLLDGCFIAEYFLEMADLREKSSTKLLHNGGWSSVFVRHDLLLLENQIPFCVVDKQLQLVGVDHSRIDKLGEPFARWFMPDATAEGWPLQERQPPRKIHHLLHLLHHCYVPSEKQESSSEKSKKERNSRRRSCAIRFPETDDILTDRKMPLYRPYGLNRGQILTVPCATALREAGVRFRKKAKPSSMLHVTFTNGLMAIPPLVITEDVKPLLANLIAFEQCNLAETYNLLSFAVFMNSLLDTPKDVAILKKCGVIVNMLANEQEVADFFGQLGYGVGVGPNHYFARLFDKVNTYCGAWWPKQKAKLKHEYIGNTWAFISVVAGSILLLLTVVQTFFAVYSYFRPPH